MANVRRALAWSALAVLAPLFTSAPARADEKQACVTAADEAQRLRDERKLVKARDQMLSCARDVCPELVRKDCMKWLADVETSLSTVTLSARDAKGRDFVDVRVSLDGAPLTGTLDGRAIFVDPGVHVFKFELAGKPPVEQKVVVREGERNRAVTAIFDVAEPSPETPPPPEGRAPVLGYVVAGAGALALGGAAFFWISGRSDIGTLRDGCGATHACAQSDVDAARTKLVIGDVVAGLGIVAIGIGVYMIVTGSTSPSTVRVGARNAQLGFFPLPGGGVANIGGAF
jgi:hypothetical protein